MASPTPFSKEGEMSPPVLQSIPSMDFNYNEIDAEDPDPLTDITWLQNLAVFGFSPQTHSDPRVKALSKLKQLKKEHGVEDLRFVDYCRALVVFATLSDRKRKEKERAKKGSAAPCQCSTKPESVRQTSGRLRRLTSWPRRRRSQKSEDNQSEEPELGQRAASSPASVSPTSKSPHSSVTLKIPPLFPQTSARQPKSAPPEYAHNAVLQSSSPPESGAIPVAVVASEDTTASKGPTVAEVELTPVSPSQVVQGEKCTSSSCVYSTMTSPAVSSTPLAAPDETVTESDEEQALPSASADHVRLLYHMLRHAESIYGLPLTMASAPLTSMRKISGLGITTARNDIPLSDMVHSKFSATTFMPAHYVAVDRNIEAVVVCVRGTANLLDSLTDVTATHDPISVRRHGGAPDDLVRGHGHSGVLRSARNLFNEIRGPALGALAANEGYELLLTGHSLGAAIAAVLSLIMRDDAEFPHALAVCIAPPPCLSWELAEETTTTAMTVVNGPDIVPRLSLPVLLPFLATARYVADLPLPQRALVALGLPSAAVEWDDLRAECRSRVAAMRETHRGKELFIPGVVFQLLRPADGAQKAPLRGGRSVNIVAVPRDEFTAVRGRERGMFFGHAPTSYRSALYSVLRAMGATKWERRPNIGRLFGQSAGSRRPKCDQNARALSDMTEQAKEKESHASVDKLVKELYKDSLRARESSAKLPRLP